MNIVLNFWGQIVIQQYDVHEAKVAMLFNGPSQTFQIRIWEASTRCTKEIQLRGNVKWMKNLSNINWYNIKATQKVLLRYCIGIVIKGLHLAGVDVSFTVYRNCGGIFMC